MFEVMKVIKNTVQYVDTFYTTFTLHLRYGLLLCAALVHLSVCICVEETAALLDNLTDDVIA